jgi:hypothetical protein
MSAEFSFWMTAITAFLTGISETLIFVLDDHPVLCSSKAKGRIDND